MSHFSSFFLHASEGEKIKVSTEAANLANQEQRRYMNKENNMPLPFRLVEYWLKRYYGSRCPDYCEDCIVCKVWKAWDEFVKIVTS